MIDERGDFIYNMTLAISFASFSLKCSILRACSSVG